MALNTQDASVSEAMVMRNTILRRDFYIVEVDSEELDNAPEEPADIDDDMGFDPYMGCYTYDC